MNEENTVATTEEKQVKEKTPRGKSNQATAPVDKNDFRAILKAMIQELEQTDQKIDIDGKKYTTVAKRNEVLRKHLGFDVQILTDYLNIDANSVVFTAKISVYRDGQWQLVATGFSEEIRNANEFNKSSALEIAETSAIGRALANLGLMGGEFASLNEMSSKTNLTSRANEQLIKHTRDMIRQAGLVEKNILASISVKDIEKITEEESLKVVKKCLAALARKDNSKQPVVNNQPESTQENGSDSEEIQF